MTEFPSSHVHLPQRRLRCRGYSLLELIATLSALLVVAVAASSMLGSITDIGLHHRHSLQERAAVRRLAENFRKDVAEAIDVVTPDDQRPLQLVCQKHVVEYRWDPSSTRLLRLVRSDGKPDGLGHSDGSGEILATDVYALTDRCHPRFIVAEDRVSMILRDQVGAVPGWMVEAWR